jgi:glycosyltransferase XagB
MATARRKRPTSGVHPKDRHVLAELRRMRVIGQITRHEFESRRAAVLDGAVVRLRLHHPEPPVAPAKAEDGNILEELRRLRVSGKIARHEFESRRAAAQAQATDETPPQPTASAAAPAKAVLALQRPSPKPAIAPAKGGDRLQQSTPERTAAPPKAVDGLQRLDLATTAAPAMADNGNILAELGRLRAFGQITQHELEVRRAAVLAEAAGTSEPRRSPRAAAPVKPEKERRLPTPEPGAALAEAVDGLRLRHPELSASRVLTRPQGLVLVGVAIVCALGLWRAPLTTGVILSGCVTAIYAVAFVNNVAIFRRLARTPQLIEVTDAEAREMPDLALPVYTVMVAAYREPEVIAATLRSLAQLEYPADRVDIMLLLEADDAETHAAVLAAHPASNVDVVLVPPSQPRTKPKALNFGLLQARGELITVYDAEDRPEPLQLRRAVVAFSRADPRVACLQAKLVYHNPRQNLLTGWFAIEYLSWFGCALPAVAHGDTPVPLGGTSMHMRRAVLDRIGAWDPFNVTEDCDLGVRLYRMGYRTAILDSTTYEEANSDPINWVKQRSRWYKGYAQTWLVHMRHPRRLKRDLGLRGFCGFNLLVGATTLTALLNPIFWMLTVTWFVLHPAFIAHIFPSWVYFPGLISMVVGNFLGYYAGLICVRAAKRADLTKAALLVPVYWLLMSIGALRAFLQLLVSPFLWEKTEHGLDRQLAPEPES